MDKNEKYLKSIDNTLKDILKELKRQARLAETTSVTINTTEINKEMLRAGLQSAHSPFNMNFN